MPTYKLSVAKANAAKIGVTVKKSTRAGKKLDVYKDGKKVASIGDPNYTDYSVHGDEQRRKNYLSRHAKTRVKVNTPSYYSWKILWS